MRSGPQALSESEELRGRHDTVRHRAFTLIELLVVVAIIAILAAIALPNFIEAQTRAKVSRARADIRTVVTAIETYRVDWNSYPLYHYSDVARPDHDFHIGGTVPSWPVPDPNWDGRNPITTPVAYLTTMPRDPFASFMGGDPPEVREYLYVNWPYAIERFGYPHPPFVFAYQAYGPYRLHCRGPDTDGPDSGVPYDPTNGTVSDGDITYGSNNGFDRFIPFPPF
ncbi:prepilin-type N-terminal cleavage/methylation domain-containing protein [Candidatus Sumerlaeota bacterium]|nr:prepilin-type N-terminal cleavage/methylation domain-containing protein [Candidatus Sumerlaeota bacterium]